MATYNHLHVARPSGIDDAMFLEATKESLHNKFDETDFKLEHMWHALRH